MLNFNASLFAFANPIHSVDRWLNPYKHSETFTLNNKPLTIHWTERADIALTQRNRPLIVEMQLYFSCLVKMRVLFHETLELQAIQVSSSLMIVFRAVQATACDPVEFAMHYPVKQQFDNPAINNVSPSQLELDFCHETWQGRFYLTAPI